MTLLRSRPLAQKSEKAKARDVTLARTKRIVLARCKGACEGCGARDGRLDLHHVVGRSEGPWGDSAEACAALCRDCHRKAQEHRDPELVAVLEIRACCRLRDQIYGPAPRLAAISGGRDGCRLIIAELERRGLQP